jgi:serine/threonine-protein kinase
MPTDAAFEAALDVLETKVNKRHPEADLAPELRALVEAVPEESTQRPRVLRLRGVVLNRSKDPDRALACLHEAWRAATRQDNFAEIAKIGREITVVHAWRGEDRDAALALLRAVAAAYLHDDASAIMLGLSEAGRIELEARRFEEAARVLSLVVNKTPQSLSDYELFRTKINLCQALNRFEKYNQALELANALVQVPPTNDERLIFLTLLERARAHAGLKNLDAANASLIEARALLPADPNKFEHNELREVEAEIKFAKEDPSAIDDLKALAKEYTEPNLTVRAANLRMMAARRLFKMQQPAEAGRLLAEALASAFKAGLSDLARRIRGEMLEGEGAKHLDAVLKDIRKIEAIGGEWSVGRQLIRVELIGGGGGGKVYRAIDLRDGQEVAVKEVSLATRSREKREQIIAQVRNEYAVAVTLPDSIGIANVRGLLSDPDGTLFIVQELIKGSPLTKLYKPEPSPSRILPLLLQVADVLASLHASGVVHRDLKPDNVMVRRGRQGEEAVLIDFGIALVDADNDTLKYYGTAGYMAPEQASGAKVDGRADIYALGKMISEVWIGDGRRGTIPNPLAGVVDLMLRDEPDKRPPLDAIKAALDTCCQPLKA